MRGGRKPGNQNKKIGAATLRFFMMRIDRSIFARAYDALADGTSARRPSLLQKRNVSGQSAPPTTTMRK